MNLTEIESVCYALEMVNEAFAFEIKGAGSQGEVHVVVSVPSADPLVAVDVSIIADKVIELCRYKLSPFQVPKRVHVFNNSLAKTADGQLDRDAVLQQLSRQLTLNETGKKKETLGVNLKHKPRHSFLSSVLSILSKLPCFGNGKANRTSEDDRDGHYPLW